jgi:hypothetical protein
MAQLTLRHWYCPRAFHCSYLKFHERAASSRRDFSASAKVAVSDFKMAPKSAMGTGFG